MFFNPIDRSGNILDHITRTGNEIVKEQVMLLATLIEQAILLAALTEKTMLLAIVTEQVMLSNRSRG